MIGFLDGKVAGRTSDSCLLDVNGVGYRLSCSTWTLSQLPGSGGRVRLHTHMHVREDVLALFGFATESEQKMFEALIAVNGVGPKVALQVCSSLDPDSLRRALVTDDLDALSSVPGIGKKTASRIVLELKEKMSLPDLQVVGEGAEGAARARSALENLGYSAAEARAALAEVSGSGERVEDLVRAALRVLSRGPAEAAE